MLNGSFLASETQHYSALQQHWTIEHYECLKAPAQQRSRIREARYEKGEAGHLFGVSFSSVKRYAKVWSIP
jgi:hypothetical protein